ncbi:MAG: heavy-metal-associated domain-containing protein [Tissierellia bacterium]|nr:heavy-metal-associated domain-containing protein [Tissierellia bacterium]
MKKILLVEGMSCGHCEKAVKEAVGQLEGVKNVEVDLEDKKVEVEGENLVDGIIKEAIEEAGYDVLDIN